MSSEDYRKRKNTSSKSKKRTSKKPAVKPTKKRRHIEEDDEPKAMKSMKQQAERERQGYTASSKKTTRKGNKKRKRKHPKLMVVLKIFIILALLMTIIGAGVIAGTFFGLFGNDFEISKEELTIASANSIIVDQEGNKIADLSGDEKRKIITLEDMADYLPKAYVAIEDERFYKHSGVDIKRTGGAILSKLIGRGTYGGSTITQQLVKNITKQDETAGLAGIMRKVKEWTKAYQVERMISKEQILELYLNILFVGGNMHGVELGSEYYFAKSAKDLDLAECAFLAGINNSPNSYNPYDTSADNSEKIKNKTKVVLNKMKELGYIENEEEYNVAIAKVDAGLTFQKAEVASDNIYSYHTDATITQIVDQIMDERGISKELAENYVYGSGLTIYSTVDTAIQTRLEEEFKKSKYIIKGNLKKDGKTVNEHSQAGMAIVDYKTGYVVGVAGGLGEKTSARGWNRATQMKKQTGSSMKPIATVAPGLEEKIITASTVYNDSSTEFSGNYTPKNYNNFRGFINIRQFIETSQNIPAIKIMAELTPEKSLTYLEKMGITSLKSKEDNVLALAIGGMKNGVSPLEMAVAYGTIANDGVCVTPTFYTKVEDSEGNTVLTPKQDSTRAISEENAYITKSILQEPVTGSDPNRTAKYCAINGISVAAKTGTTDKDYDRWLCGFTPYYSAACWFGYDENEEVKYSGGNPAGLIWSSVMSDIHKSLEKATFKKPDGIVEQTICNVTGGLATTGCTSTRVEIFTKDNIPEKCEGHGIQTLCTESNLIATEYCPSTKTNTFGSTIPKEQLKLWKTISGTTTAGTKVNETCNIHTKPEVVENPPAEVPRNNTNTNNENTNTNSGGNTNTSGNQSGGTGNTNTGNSNSTTNSEDKDKEN